MITTYEKQAYPNMIVEKPATHYLQLDESAMEDSLMKDFLSSYSFSL